MKKKHIAFKIPIYAIIVDIYPGKKFYKKFRKDVKICGYEVEKYAPISSKGLAAGGAMWIEDIKDTSTIYHELYHVVDNISTHLRLKDSESRAYLSEYIFHRSMKEIKKFRKGF